MRYVRQTVGQGDGKGWGANPKTYYDYRKMLDEVGKDIDVVLIATPDHHHAPAAMRAIMLGKHVFCQKPLAYNISECHALAKAAKENKVLTQMGNQGHCGDAIRRVCEYIWAGALGNVTEVHAILGRNFGGTGGRLPTKPVPAGVHWDEWIGPAAFREYHEHLDPFEWRSWREFGTGTIGDMACHNMDALFWALKLGEAKSYTIECTNQKGGSKEMFPTDNVVRWDVPARGDMKAVKVFSYDHGGIRPQIMIDVEKKFGRRLPEELFVGDNGLYIGNDSRIIPEEKFKEIPQPPRTLPVPTAGRSRTSSGQSKNNGTPCSNFPDAAAPLLGVRPFGPPGDVRRSGPKGRIRRGENGSDQHPRSQQVYPPRGVP